MSDKDKKSKLQASKKDIEDGKSLAWLSYLGLLLLIPLLVKPDNSFCKHHAKQGLVLLLIWIGVFIVGIIPFLHVIAILGYIGLVVFAIVGIVQSLSGNYWKAPLGIYELAQKFNI
jgi:uncharacterized membrane protein